MIWHNLNYCSLYIVYSKNKKRRNARNKRFWGVLYVFMIVERTFIQKTKKQVHMGQRIGLEETEMAKKSLKTPENNQKLSQRGKFVEQTFF